MVTTICQRLPKIIRPKLDHNRNTSIFPCQTRTIHDLTKNNPNYNKFLFSQFRPITTTCHTLTCQYLDNNKVTQNVMHHTTSFLLPSQQQQQHCLKENNNNLSLKYALIVLNQPLIRFTPLLWDQAKVRICADGGANRLFDQIPQFYPQQHPLDVRKRYKPDVIKGDLDSIRSDALEFYTKLGCDVVDDSHDQDTTDLHKCINHLRDTTPESEISNLCILVTGALGGRFDHEAPNINVLHYFSNLRIILLSEDSLIQLLPKNRHHRIHIESSVVGPHCGLLPLAGPSLHITTSGLQWNLNDTEMRIGGLISTSNLVSGDTVSVHSDSDLIWTISIKNRANQDQF